MAIVNVGIGRTDNENKNVNIWGAAAQRLRAGSAWAFAERWKTVLGLRAEDWRASDGSTAFSATSSLNYPSRNERYLSPKAALSFQAAPDLVLKASTGRAVRMPTVSELYGATSTTNSQYINDPNLKPEKSWTTELTAEKDLGHAVARLTYFTEDTHDSLYAQTTFDPVANKNISRVQNVGRIRTNGLEFAFNGADVLAKGLDVAGSVTYADSVIKANDGFVVTPGDTVGKRQPNIPRWRATALVSYRFDEQWSVAYGARYSGRAVYRTLNNADVNGSSTRASAVHRLICACATGSTAVVRGTRHRQPEQRPLLELSPSAVPATPLQRELTFDL